MTTQPRSMPTLAEIISYKNIHEQSSVSVIQKFIEMTAS